MAVFESTLFPILITLAQKPQLVGNECIDTCYLGQRAVSKAILIKTLVLSTGVHISSIPRYNSLRFRNSRMRFTRIMKFWYMEYLYTRNPLG